MRFFYFVAVTLLLVLPATALAEYTCPQPPDKLIVLRHARRANDNEDSGLSKRGWEEAGRLVGLIGDEPISGIFVSNKRRSQETALPLSLYLQVTPTVIEDTPEGTDQLLSRICEWRRGGTVVHVGHTYTLDKIFAAFEVDADVEGSEPIHEITWRARGARHRRIQ